MNVVWFKRDLRIHDHQALLEASKLGPVLPLYILEPELWQQPDMSERQYAFLQDCITELNQALQTLGQPLIIKVGCATDILQNLHEKYKINTLWSHQETWNNWTFQRDLNVKKWCEDNHIPWHEPVQNGVVRKLKNRDGWASLWYAQMNKKRHKSPEHLPALTEKSATLPSADDLNIPKQSHTHIQKGGRSEAVKLLKSFLYGRGQGYTKEMSSPVTAYESCSRLSAHLAFGTLSIREVFHACEKRSKEIKNTPTKAKGKWSSAMRSFAGRLRWHCHFIQKLESEPAIEFTNMHPAYNGLREPNFNEDHFNAWKNGCTGYPMIDACMRALTATGWLNFRMRAMVTSFASYHLWLHWQKTAQHLATLFTDYEPGIHYSQAQMQSGTTGINAIRIYNPIKQGIDQDPEGLFIRKWIPELAHVKDEYIHTPWLSSNKGDYPDPIVDEKTARKFAAEKIYGLRKQNPEHKKSSDKIIKKHASRKPTKKRKSKKTNNPPQLEFKL